ncbi:hypothetical protein BZG36_04070 [Bifiguratus adelaidae]|uniref:Uncharacterized protein n=1 Tax=Bifiguratus adelaidae TaxID=1938954 RepID=A0A261XXT0_9FUNG|nr:hypothetical protein BZG36_04070 [Bifiguratus adelaidae]
MATSPMPTLPPSVVDVLKPSTIPLFVTGASILYIGVVEVSKKVNQARHRRGPIALPNDDGREDGRSVDEAAYIGGDDIDQGPLLPPQPLLQRIERMRNVLTVISPVGAITSLVAAIWTIFDGLHEPFADSRAATQWIAFGVWMYTLVLHILAKLHKLPWALVTGHTCMTLVVLFLCLFYSDMKAYQDWKGIHALGLESTSIPEMSAVVWFGFMIAETGLTAIGMIVAGLTPRELDPEMVLQTGMRYSNEKHALPGEATSSFFGWVIFSWMNPTIHLGNQKVLQSNDLPELLPENRAKPLWDRFKRTSPASRLVRRLWYFNQLDFAGVVSFSFIQTFMDFTTPYFLNKILTYVNNPGSTTKETAALYVFGMLIAQIGKTVFASQMFYLTRRIDIRGKGYLNSELYGKALKIRDVSGLVSAAAATSGIGAKDTKDDQKDAQKKDDKKDKKNSANSQPANVGKIVNLMSVDTNRVTGCMSFIHILVGAPMSLIIGGFLLYQLLGWSSLVGMAMLFVTMPLNSMTSRLFRKLQKLLMEARDERVSQTNEIFQAIRMIKFFAWERTFAKKVMKARDAELRRVIHTYIVHVLFFLLFQAAPLLVTLLSFLCYTKAQGGELTAPIAFTAILLFERLRFPLNALPQVIVAVVNAGVSLERIAQFLEEGEIDSARQTITERDGNGQYKIALENVTAQWYSADGDKDDADADADTREGTLDTNRFYVKDISATFPVGELSIVCGPTGSGKSALLMALLGELDILSGKVFLPRRAPFSKKTVDPTTGYVTDGVAYVPQQAWLQNATIKNNILFGEPFDAERYEEVLQVCALKRDLEILDDGDETEIGEKGITLSGGQKQRVSLARAVYSRAQHVLMDDCLSAVDSHTGKWIYEKCIIGPLMKGRTQILVTHHVGLCLPGAKYLVQMLDGQVKHADGVTALRLTDRLKDILDSDEIESTPVSETQSVSEGSSDTIVENVTLENVENSAGEESDETQTTDGKPVGGQIKRRRSLPHVLVKDEVRQEGRVKWQIYKLYFSASGGIIFWGLVVLMHGLSRFANIGENWWLRQWANAYGEADSGVSTTMSAFGSFDGYMRLRAQPFDAVRYTHTEGSWIAYPFNMLGDYAKDNVTIFKFSGHLNVDYYISIYALICFGELLINVLTDVVVYIGSLKASRKLYEDLMYAVVRAPLRFFDTTPVGRIMTRFSRDFEVIDSNLAPTCNTMLMYLIACGSIIAVITFITPMFLFSAIFIVAIFAWVGKRYLTTSRELKRLDSVTKAPIYSQFGETIVGVPVVRAFGAQAEFMEEMLRRLDNGNRPYYWLWNANRWLSVRCDTLGAFVAFFAGAFIVFGNGAIDAGLAGISLLYALSFVNSMNWVIRVYTQLEMDLNSVERVQEYMSMPQEQITGAIEPPAAWPQEGKIEVDNLVIQYAPDLERVIRNITFSVDPQSKVGVVGRTGSGKSTLASSLFRFVDPTEGKIVIDGVDITTIGVEDLRSRLTIIPQDPVLFSGTLRSNLDPFNVHEDSQIWEALRRVHLIEGDEDMAEGTTRHVAFSSLDNLVSEGGGNYSHGQRQLLCLARALLRNSKIIVMDEATASVDFSTDQKIQKTIREEFSESTLVCIAHRLRTIIDYNKVLVLDHGVIAEYDTPYNLLTGKKYSIFKDMCMKSGEFDLLMEMAYARHNDV